MTTIITMVMSWTNQSLFKLLQAINPKYDIEGLVSVLGFNYINTHNDCTDRFCTDQLGRTYR